MRSGNDISIGRLAARTGCSVPTIRYYEEIGLLPRAARGTGGQRIYGEADLRRLTFIRRCRDFGFAIEQIGALLALAGTTQDCTAARDLAQRHLGEVHAKLRELRALQRTLKQIVADCTTRCAGGPAGRCVILADLARPSRCGRGTTLPAQGRSRHERS